MARIGAWSSVPNGFWHEGSLRAFGNTEPDIRVKAFGLKERGKGEGTFKPATGTGYVKKTDGD